MTVVTGASGQLGTAFRRLLPTATFLDRSGLDLSDVGSLRARLDTLRPERLINCAAYTAVDRAEDEQELANTVNGAAVRELAAFCAAHDVPFVTFSTDYVFSGISDRPWVESDQVDPINAYGRSKLIGEEAVAELGGLAVRTSWLVSGTHPNFIATMLRLAASGNPMRVVNDQVGCPTIVDDLAAATMHAIDAGVEGLLHLANRGATTWHDFAAAAIAHAGLEPELEPCGTDDFPTPARRPAYSVLVSERLGEYGLEPLPEWTASLPGVVDALYTNAVVVRP